MRRVRIFACVGAACLFVASQAAVAQTEGYRITGVVVDANTGNPVARSHLEASLTGARRAAGGSVFGGIGAPGGGPRRGPAFGGSANVSIDADEHGHFVLSLPSAGAWHLAASAQGYVSQAFAAHGLYSSSVVLTEKAPVYDLRFQLPHEGRIAGTILDEAGEAVRNAAVTLYVQPLSGPSVEVAPFQTRGITQTDDRGSYEFDGLTPATYRVLVNARPWYASANQRSSAAGASPEPSLDVSYSPSWYPGGNDPAQAEAIQLTPGDVQTADFQLTPIPSLHLIIIPPQATAAVPGRPSVPIYPVIEPIDSMGGRMGQSQVSTRRADGSIDVGGLTPGTYRVSLQGQPQGSTVVQINSGAARTLDMRQLDAEMAQITFHFDGNDSGDGPMIVELVDPVTGHRYSSNGRMMGIGAFVNGGSAGSRGEQTERGLEMQVPPGRYEVFVQGRRGTFLTGISAQGAEVQGRFVNVHAGEVMLTLRTAEGRATVTGTVTFTSKPSVAAAVLLVPAGLGDPQALTMVVRDQTNTDGSFELPSVIPGQYILIAVDHGWQINWNDLSTLRRYLVHGVPLELSRETKIHHEIVAQSP